MYRAGTRIFAPTANLLLSYRTRQGKEDSSRRGERLGVANTPRPSGQLIWIHAASVGETNAVLPLIGRLMARRPGLRLLLTTGTKTSAAVAAERLPQGVIHQYVPLDIPQVVQRFLDHWKPSLIVLTESEIWPNTIMEASDRKIPVAIVNARLSQRSHLRWRRSRRAARALFSRLRLVLAQSELLQRRFRELGARDTRNYGNLKIDSPPLPIDAGRRGALQSAVAGRPVFLAASTHDREEQAVIEAHRLLAAHIPNLLTIIAPRHPERGAEVVRLAQGAGLVVAQRSNGGLPGPNTELYVADTIGELGILYSITPVAFVGGSLIDRGGQNPIEAVRLGAVVLTGPSTRNFSDAYGELVRRDGATVVATSEAMADVARQLLQNPEELLRRQQAAAAALERLTGALEKTAETLLELVPELKEIESAP